MSARRRLAGGLLTLACVGALAACGGDDVNQSSEAIEVELGDAFSWNGFTVEEGWELTGIQRSVDMEEVTTPEVKGTITNAGEEERAAIFAMVFSADGSALATVSCSAATMAVEQSQQFICPGLSATMPADYDTITVQEYVRDDGSSSS